MEMPRPGDAHKKLSALVGEWTGDETLHPSPWDPAGGSARARVTNRWIADGFAVVQEYEQTRNGRVTFRGHGVFWFDPARNEYVMHWWDSMGGSAGEYRGGFDGDTLVLRAPMPQGGHSRTSWSLTGADAHGFLMEVSPDASTWQPAMEGRYVRARAGRSSRSSAAAPTRQAAAPGRRATKKAARKPARAAGRSRGGTSARSTAKRKTGKSGRRRR